MNMHFPSSWGILSFAVFCCFVQACTSKAFVREDEPVNNDRVLNFQQVNARLEDQTFVLTAKDGSEYFGESISVLPDSTRFTDRVSHRRIVLATRSVAEIRRADHVLGAASGFLVGLGIGALYAVIQRPKDESTAWSALLFFGGSMIGGTVVGTLRGSEEELIFPRQDALR